MSQRLKVVVDLPENLDSVHRTHIVVHMMSGLCGHLHTQGTHTYTLSLSHTNTHKIK